MSLTSTLQELGLLGHHVSLAQMRGGDLVSACVETVEQGERFFARGGETDSYICGNPVKPGTVGKPSDADILEARVLLVDCDPIKTDQDPKGTSQEARDAAWDLASAIFDHFQDHASLVDSGRGGQVWLRVSPFTPRKKLLKWIAENFVSDLAKVDPTHNVDRLMRLPGSVNTRTGELVTVISPYLGDPLTDFSFLEGWDVPVEVEVPDADRSPPTKIDERRWLSGDALKLWRQDPMEITTDRSTRDFKFLLSLLKRECPADVASRLLHALPGSKAAERGDDSYWVSTYQSAAKAVGENKINEEVLSDFVARVEADPQWVLTPQAIRALAHLQREDMAAWAGMRAKIKPPLRKAGVSIMDVEALVNAHRKEQARFNKPEPPDDLVVFVRERSGGTGNWFLKDEKGPAWTQVSRTDAEKALSAHGRDPELTVVAQQQSFAVTLKHFAPRVLPGRTWNVSDARYAVEPKPGPHPTWSQLYDVVGRGLDADVGYSDWCKDNGITSGGDYLFAWASTMLQDPASRRAYLFLFSPEQGTGKSLFFESFSYLIGDAVVKASNALTNERGFNAELQGAVLAYSEEVNIGRDGARNRAYNRIKSWSLDAKITIEPKGGNAYDVPNMISWGQASNDETYCPVFAGDDRITMYMVEGPRDGERVHKEVMRARLRAEAPAFLHALLTAPQPAATGRYAVPPIMTEAKDSQAHAARTDFQTWLALREDACLMSDEEMRDEFFNWLEASRIGTRFWSVQRMLRELPWDVRAARKVYRESVGQGGWGFDDLTASDVTKALKISLPPSKVGRALSILQRTGVVARRILHGRTLWSFVPDGGGAGVSP